MSKVQGLEDKPENGSTPPPAASAVGASPPQPSSRRRRSSILKNTSDSDEEATTADRPTTHRRRVSFTSVDIAEHDLTLGDHPDCSYGPPTALDWKPTRRHSIDLEEYEGSRCKVSGSNPRRTRRQLVINYYDRKDAIKKAGYTDKDIRKATKKKERAKNLRSITRSYANTPAGKVEELISSVGRKFKKVVKITPSSSSTSSGSGGNSKKDKTKTTTDNGAVLEQKESPPPDYESDSEDKKNVPAKDLKDDSTPSTNAAMVTTPAMKSVVSASA